MVSPALRRAGKSALHRAFRAGQRLGVDVLPRHFYSGVPDLHALASSTTWQQPRSLAGLSGFDEQEQLATLQGWFTDDVRARLTGRDLQQEAAVRNGAVGYGPTESAVLHAFAAAERPARVVQVGAGASTAVLLAAAREHGFDTAVTAVDPFPTAYLEELAAAGEITLDRRPAQEVDLEVFTALGPGDLLFVDSTHTVKPGSEVNRLVLEVLPRLAPGVWVHFHDIWTPYDYPPDLLEATLFFWNESVLLHAYLADNQRMTTVVNTCWLHHRAPAGLARVVPGYHPRGTRDGLYDGTHEDGHFPSACYLRVTTP